MKTTEEENRSAASQKLSDEEVEALVEEVTPAMAENLKQALDSRGDRDSSAERAKDQPSKP